MTDAFSSSAVPVLTALGAALTAWLALRPRVAELRAKLEAVTNERDALAQSRSQDAAALALARKEAGDERDGRVRLAAQLEALDAAHQKAYETMKAESAAAFAGLAAKALEDSNKSFLTLALAKFDGTKTSLATLLTPVEANLKAFNEAIIALEKTRIEDKSLLTTHISKLTDAESKLVASTGDLAAKTGELTEALRNPRTRGQWGEITLHRVVERAGMLEHVDFKRQQSFGHEEGRDQPDVTVWLENNQFVFIDSKVPADSYLDALAAKSEGEQREHLGAFAKNVRRTIDDLDRKKYIKHEGSAPFMILFMPSEALFCAAVSQEPDLIEFGMNKNIYLTSPLTLLALLQSYALGWKFHNQEINAQQIAALGKQLFESVANVTENFSKMGSALSRLISSYNSLAGTIDGRLKPRARRMAELGVGQLDALADIAPLDEMPRALKADPQLALGEGAGQSGIA